MTNKTSDISIISEGPPIINYASAPGPAAPFDPDKHERIGGDSGSYVDKREAQALRAAKELERTGSANAMRAPIDSTPQSDPENWQKVGETVGQVQNNGGVWVYKPALAALQAKQRRESGRF